MKNGVGRKLHIRKEYPKSKKRRSLQEKHSESVEPFAQDSFAQEHANLIVDMSPTMERASLSNQAANYEQLESQLPPGEKPKSGSFSMN